MVDCIQTSSPDTCLFNMCDVRDVFLLHSGYPSVRMHAMIMPCLPIIYSYILIVLSVYGISSIELNR